VPRRVEKIAGEPRGISVKNDGGSGPGMGGSGIRSSSAVSISEFILKYRSVSERLSALVCQQSPQQ
jgi:hypothetical protein